MHLTLPAASGATGLALTGQALERGHTARTVARTPARIGVADSPGPAKVAADVRERFFPAFVLRRTVAAAMPVRSKSLPRHRSVHAHLTHLIGSPNN
ncbi:hypothetical protein GCM10017779_67690 [Streptomyces capillispiralis]|uniref:NAD(P)-binding protein n=1 Tax=Streptomyces capillispiralis TaxID=68182 RepID=A0A561SGL9_9ACTN|nr:hypothetical protein FHX78_1230 [Streptomyces capillispiralis]GHH96312.1 hypothetical protein GCM10017779_67690 [Streptomyces capillispiralis]